MPTISNAYIGNTPVSGIYRGSVPLWVPDLATPGGGGGGFAYTGDPTNIGAQDNEGTSFNVKAGYSSFRFTTDVFIDTLYTRFSNVQENVRMVLVNDAFTEYLTEMPFFAETRSTSQWVDFPLPEPLFIPVDTPVWIGYEHRGVFNIGRSVSPITAGTFTGELVTNTEDNRYLYTTDAGVLPTTTTAPPPDTGDLVGAADRVIPLRVFGYLATPGPGGGGGGVNIDPWPEAQWLPFSFGLSGSPRTRIYNRTGTQRSSILNSSMRHGQAYGNQLFLNRDAGVIAHSISFDPEYAASFGNWGTDIDGVASVFGVTPEGVFVSNTSETRLLDKETGADIWKKTGLTSGMASFIYGCGSPGKFWLPGNSLSNVRVIDIANGDLLDTIVLNNACRGVVVDPAGQFAYVATTNRLYKIDTATLDIVTEGELQWTNTSYLTTISNDEVVVFQGNTSARRYNTETLEQSPLGFTYTAVDTAGFDAFGLYVDRENLRAIETDTVISALNTDATGAGFFPGPRQYGQGRFWPA